MAAARKRKNTPLFDVEPSLGKRVVERSAAVAAKMSAARSFSKNRN
jgi:hypothetical protein